MDLPPPHAKNDNSRSDERRRMIEDIVEMADDTRGYAAPAISQGTLDAIARVPRHLFVPADENFGAYFNHPLPIGHGQTISQPYIVALMTELLAIRKDHRLLEIGTGSGYQSAVLAELAGEVYSMEIVEPLAFRASELLKRLNYANVHVKHGDGNRGWPEHAPYDGIIVTAAARQIPPALPDQLKPGGRLVIPVGDRFVQELLLITKHEDGLLHSTYMLPVSFVPLTGDDRPN